MTARKLTAAKVCTFLNGTKVNGSSNLSLVESRLDLYLLSLSTLETLDTQHLVHYTGIFTGSCVGAFGKG